MRRNRLLPEILAWSVGTWAATRATSALVISGMVYWGGIKRGEGVSEARIASVPFFLVVAAGGLLNDYFDRNRDAIDKPWRLIPTGRLNPGIVLVAGYFFLGCGLWCAITAAHYTKNELAIYVVASAGVILYNWIVAYAALVKGVVVGVLCALPLVFTAGGLSGQGTVLCLGTIVFIWGRETLMDVLDVKGDSKAKSYTLPQYCGEVRVVVIAFGSQFVGLFIFIAGVTHGNYTRDVIAHAFATSILCGVVLLWINAPSMRRTSIYLMWAPLICELCVLLSGTVKS
jgi:4-hydroxybenzoate polyprenyltransferase